MRYRITLYDFWHAGGLGSSDKDTNSRLLKDDDGTPIYTAKTLNGLLRENMDLIDAEKTEIHLGKEGAGNNGKIVIDDAMLVSKYKKQIVRYGLQKELYDTVDSTAISEQGTAVPKSLRSVEVAIPMILEGEIELNDSDIGFVTHAMGMIKEIGLKRNRGLGRCDIVLLDSEGEVIQW